MNSAVVPLFPMSEIGKSYENPNLNLPIFTPVNGFNDNSCSASFIALLGWLETKRPIKNFEI